MADHFVDMSDILLSFNEHIVLDHADFYLNRGEICAILGENAAGKSSLMKVLAGIFPLNSGTISIDGQRVNTFSIAEMHKLGVYMIQQTSQLVDFFTIEENVFIGTEQNYPASLLLNKKYQLRRTQEILDFLQCPLSPSQRVETLPTDLKMIVEIAKALARNAKVLIFDETTASMTSDETEGIFRTLRQLANSGIGIVFISHKLEDVLKIADRIVIMRDGKVIDNQTQNIQPPALSYDAILSKMAGPDYTNRYPKTKAPKGEVLLRMHHVSSCDNIVKDAGLYIRRGEIVGIAGLQGAGKTSLTRVVAGVDKIKSGTIALADSAADPEKKDSAQDQTRVALLSSVNGENVIGEHSVLKNITLPSLSSFQRGPLLNRKKCFYHTKNVLDRFGIKNAEPGTKVKWLSSGTQQKIAIAKLINTHPDLLVMDEPSNNLDISSKVELFNIMNKLTHNGCAILFASSDIPELIGMCDRIYIMFGGRIVAELDARETSSVNILTYATGHWN